MRDGTLLAFAPGSGLPDVVRERGFQVAPHELSLARTVANLAKYPVGLLTAPADDVVAVLQAVGSRHLGGASGIFRSARSVTTILQCRDQRVAPVLRVQPLHSLVITEEEKVVSHLPDNDFQHQRLALHSLLRRLGQSAWGNSFSGAQLPFPLYWFGASLPRTVKDYLKPKRAFRNLFRRFRDHGDHGLVFLSPGHGYFSYSTLPLLRVGLADNETAFETKISKRRYVFETFGQFGSRLPRLG